MATAGRCSHPLNLGGYVCLRDHTVGIGQSDSSIAGLVQSAHLKYDHLYSETSSSYIQRPLGPLPKVAVPITSIKRPHLFKDAALFLGADMVA
jgi:hypothetical protein